MSIHVCVYIYIYVYIYVCVCVCVDLCVLWVAGGIMFSIFEAVSECLEDIPLSILAWRPHKKLCPNELARSEERTKDVGESGVRLWSRESEIQSPGGESGVVVARMLSLAVKNEDTKQWRWWPDEPASLVAV